MTKKKSTKRALISSMLILAMCFTMLAGTTFAWFTDSVESGSNIIKSGKLDIDLEVLRSIPGATATDPATEEYVSIGTDASPIFNYELWEPGYTEWANVRVINKGNLALKYTMKIAATGEVSKLAEVIDVYYAASEVAKPADRDLSGLTKIGTLKDALNGTIVINDKLEAQNDADYATIALHMQEEAGNEYQELSIGSAFTFQILATQWTKEVDAFDDQYDAAAEFPVAEVATFDELKAAIENPDIVSVTLTDNIDVTQSLTVSGKTMTLDMNGKTISNTNDIWGDTVQTSALIAVSDGADVTITGNGEFIAKDNDCYAAVVYDEASLTIENGTFVGNIHAVYVHDGNLVINGGDYSIVQLASPNPYDLLINCLDANYNNGTASYVINGGTFHGFNPAESNSEPGGIHNFVGAGKTVTADTTTTPVTYTVG